MYFQITTFEHKPEQFNVPEKIKDDIYSIVEEAAKIYFWGLGGWSQVWPLDFLITTDSGEVIGEFIVWILSAEPEFDVVDK